MESFLRKYGWALNGVLIAIAALLAALVVSSLLSTELAPYTVPALGELEAEKKKKTTRRPKLPKRVDKAKELAKRCLMECEPEEEGKGDEAASCPEEGCPDGQSCQEGVCVAGEAPPALGEAGAAGIIVASDLNATLQGVMVARPNRWSTALIQDPTTKETYVLSPGDQVLGVAELVEVRRDRIIIERNGRKEFIKLFGAISGDPSAKRAALPSTRPAPKVTPTAGAVTRKAQEVKTVTQGVTEVGKGQYRVERDAINAALKDKRSLSKGATVVPNYSNGKKNGLKLIGVKNDSVYGTLGMKSGDVLRSVNGKQIKSQAHAAELFDQFREADEVGVEIERGGKKQKLQYKIK